MLADRIEKDADGGRALPVGREDGANGYWRRRIGIEQGDEAARDDCVVDLIADELRDSATVESGVQDCFHRIGFEPRTASRDRRLGSSKMQIAGRGKAFEQQYIVVGELGRCLGRTASGEIIGRGDQCAPDGAEADREKRAVSEFGNSDGNIHTFLGHPHESVGKQQAYAKLWVISEEAGEDRTHVHPAEDGRGCQHQQTAWFTPSALDLEPSIFELGESVATSLKERCALAGEPD